MRDVGERAEGSVGGQADAVQDIEANDEGVGLVVVLGGGEGLDFFEELVQPWGVVGQEDAATFDEGQDGVGACDFVGCARSRVDG